MRGPGRLFWKLFLGTLLLAAVVLAVCTWLIARRTGDFIDSALVQHLRGQAYILSDLVGNRLTEENSAELDRLAKRIAAGHPSPIRLTFILADGRVLGDSVADPAEMESHAGRREVVEALRQGWGDDVHLSRTLSLRMHYLAVRVGPPDAPQGVVRVAMSTEAMGARTAVIRDLSWRVFLVGSAALVVFALGLARLWSRPIQHMTATARSLSRGDLSARIHVSGKDEVAQLGRSLNQMRDHLAEQLETIDRQRRILESLLSQLLEGVVVASSDGRVVLINPAAVRLLGLSGQGSVPISFEHKHVQEIISHPQLREMLLGRQDRNGDENDRPAGGEAARVWEARIRAHTHAGEVSLLTRASDIRLPHLAEAGGRSESSTARLLVLTDVSELAMAMQVKTDFAANASHELRTPLSAIMGAVETLLEMDVARDPGAARQFIQIVHRHAERMQAMVADLLDLSRLESTPDQFRPQRLVLPQQISELHARHAEAIEQRGLKWRVDIEAGADTLAANAHLLRLILDNLVDNSIKFTEPGGFVEVRCRRLVDPVTGLRSVCFEVADNGCGIPPDQQGRVFERFYQVELARSGTVRGTGLGLSIVRHAVAAMGGRVELCSDLGNGTTVMVIVPQPEPAVVGSS